MTTNNENKSVTKNTVRGLIRGLFGVPPEVAKARLDICEACEQFRKATKMCKVCKCIMPAKVHMSPQKCPLGKWHAYEPAGGDRTIAAPRAPG